MNAPDLERLASDLGYNWDGGDQKDLERIIERELRDLQIETLSLTQAERRRVLTEAHGRLQKQADDGPSTEIVALSPTALGDLVRAAVVASSPRPSPEERMRAGAQVAVTQARKDFRNGRTLPLAGSGAAAAFLWSQRATFGVDLTGVGATLFGFGALSALLLACSFLLASWRGQQRDLHRLKSLYSPVTQAAALRHMSALEFTLDDYRNHLGRLSLDRRFNGGPVHRSILSTVDLESALDDASELALERFTKLRVIEPVVSWTGMDYRIAEEHSPSFRDPEF